MIRFIVLYWGFMASALAGEGFDHSHSGFRDVLQGAVSDTGVDYRLLATRKTQLDRYLSVVSEASVTSFSKDQQLVFWVNAYNAYTISLILEEQMPKSIMDLDNGKVWDTRKYSVAGQQLSLNAMEHKKARPLTDGRVHAALNCASKGCPPLGRQPLRADSGAPTVDKQLDDAARRWVATNAYSVTSSGPAVSQIFDWFSDDFRRWGPVNSESGDVKKTRAIGFIKAFGAPVGDVASVTFQTYDWSLNQR